MRSFEYYTPTKVLFGKDTHLKIGELLKDYNCHKVLIHYGSESAVKSGLIHEISKCLTEAGIDFVTLGGVVPNPRLSKVREGISLCQKESVDFILAVGGGSVIDSAKAIGYGVVQSMDRCLEFFSQNRDSKCLSSNRRYPYDCRFRKRNERFLCHYK